MSSVNVLNLEMESSNVVSAKSLGRLRKNLNQDSIIQILREYFPSEYYFDYDMMGFNDFSLEDVVENVKVFSRFDLIKDNLIISNTNKLQINLNGIEFRRNDDFEICMVLLIIGIKIGGWAKGSWREWTEDDGDIFKQCVFNYDIDGLIYHSSYKCIEAEINDDGINWDAQETTDEVNFLEILNPGLSTEYFEENDEEITAFLKYISYNFVADEIITEVFESSEKDSNRIYKAKIQGTDKEITEWIYDQAKLKYAFERSGLIRGKKDKDGDFKWRVIG